MNVSVRWSCTKRLRSCATVTTPVLAHAATHCRHRCRSRGSVAESALSHQFFELKCMADRMHDRVFQHRVDAVSRLPAREDTRASPVDRRRRLARAPAIAPGRAPCTLRDPVRVLPGQASLKSLDPAAPTPRTSTSCSRGRRGRRDEAACRATRTRDSLVCGSVTDAARACFQTTRKRRRCSSCRRTNARTARDSYARSMAISLRDVLRHSHSRRMESTAAECQERRPGQDAQHA